MSIRAVRSDILCNNPKLPPRPLSSPPLPSPPPYFWKEVTSWWNSTFFVGGSSCRAKTDTEVCFIMKQKPFMDQSHLERDCHYFPKELWGRERTPGKPVGAPLLSLGVVHAAIDFCTSIILATMPAFIYVPVLGWSLFGGPHRPVILPNRRPATPWLASINHAPESPDWQKSRCSWTAWPNCLFIMTSSLV